VARFRTLPENFSLFDGNINNVISSRSYSMVQHIACFRHTPEGDIIALPPDDVEQVKASEMNDLNRSKPNWTCTVHFDDFKLREIVVEHLKSTYVLS
jgi:hypothetical protein